MTIATINPATGETLRTFTPLTPAELEARLACAASAFRRHRRTPFAERRRLMLKAAEIIESEKETFGRLMVTEMGKPLKAAIEEAAKSALGCRYYADNAERFLADELIETSASKSWVAYQPIGPVLAIMPWNFPFWQVFRFAAPALMAGNVGLLKHASNVPQCALAIEDIFRRAGFAVHRDKWPQLSRVVTRRLRTLAVGDEDYIPIYGGEAVLSDAHVVGRLRSCGYGFTVRKNLAYAYLPVELKPGAQVAVEVFGRMMPATVMRDRVLEPQPAR